MQQLQPLLDKLGIIRLRQESSKPIAKFNLFRILRQESDEVNLHSRFLYELFNPQGSHEMGDIFLQHFADICNLPALSYDNVQVFREYANIDILIRDNQQAIVIENKIYASDQHEQLNRYHEYATKSYLKPTLLYLTLDGKEPSDWSLGSLQAEVKLISYSTEIDKWLIVCIKEAAMRPGLRETLIQYQTLIRSLTGNNMDEGEKKAVLNLMAQDNNAESAAIIARNWNRVRWHTERDFWTELLAIIELNYAVLPDSKFTDTAIHTVINGYRNKDYYYGIILNVGRVNNTDIKFKIERGQEPIYYGFPHFFTDEIQRSRVLAALQLLGASHNEWWAAWKHSNSGIDFQNFNNSTTLQLANPDKRQKIVGELWKEIQDFISKGAAVLQVEFGSDFVPANI